MTDQYQQIFKTINSICDGQSIDRNTTFKRLVEKLKNVSTEKLIAIEVLLDQQPKKCLKRKNEKES